MKLVECSILSTYDSELAELVLMLNPGPLCDRDCPNMMGVCNKVPLECGQTLIQKMHAAGVMFLGR